MPICADCQKATQGYEWYYQDRLQPNGMIKSVEVCNTCRDAMAGVRHGDSDKVIRLKREIRDGQERRDRISYEVMQLEHKLLGMKELKDKISQLEYTLASCQEANRRLLDAYKSWMAEANRLKEKYESS